MQLLVQLEDDFLQTQIQLKTPKQEGGEQEVGGELWELGWEAEEVVVVVEALMKGEVAAVAVGQEVVGLLLRPGLGLGATGVGEEVQVVLGQHLVPKRKKTAYSEDIEDNSFAIQFFVYEKLIPVSFFLIDKKTLQVSAGETILTNALEVLQSTL